MHQSNDVLLGPVKHSIVIDFVEVIKIDLPLVLDNIVYETVLLFDCQ